MATNSPADLNSQYENRLIELELIDPPANPERETMDEQALAELALNIAEIGLIKPLIVKGVGARYEVTAGHRRYLACGLVNYSPVPCRLQINDNVDPLAILVSENVHVERVNAIEEARFYRRVYDERCGQDVDRLCAMVRRRREYVEDRLLLLDGYPNVVDALERNRIKISVARELNKTKDPNLLLILLDTAIQQGATARQVEQWRRDGELNGPIQLPAVDPSALPANGEAAAPAFEMKCFFCQTTKHTHSMRMVYLHEPCQDIVEGMLGRGGSGNGGEAN